MNFDDLERYKVVLFTLEDMKVEKRSNCVYTPLQISLSYIVKILETTSFFGVI